MKIYDTIKKLYNFLGTGIWSIRADELPASKSFFLNQLRVLALARRGFAEDQCQLRASALTFYTLLSIVPLAAMLFGIAKGFGFEQMLQQDLIERFPGQEDVLNKVIEFAQNLLENTKGGVVAGVGIVVLFWTVIQLLSNIELSFNHIWGIDRARSMKRKFADYLSVILICPILVVMSSSVTVFLNTQLQSAGKENAAFDALSHFLQDVSGYLPMVVLWAVFTFLYMFFPNTLVRFYAGLIAGVITGTLFQGLQWLYIYAQFGISHYNAIYGSFAALPLFLIWLQLSWMIVLFGAELSYAEQNVRNYEFKPDTEKITGRFRKLMALRITQMCVRAFQDSQTPPREADIQKSFRCPADVIHQVVEQLIQTKILVRVVDERDQMALQPARPVEQLTIAEVLRLLDQNGGTQLPQGTTEDFHRLSETLQEFDSLIAQSPNNVPLSQL